MSVAEWWSPRYGWVDLLTMMAWAICTGLVGGMIMWLLVTAFNGRVCQ